MGATAQSVWWICGNTKILGGLKEMLGQTPFKYYDDKDYYPVYIFAHVLDAKIQYLEVAVKAEVDDAWFFYIRGGYEASLRALGLLYRVTHGIDLKKEDW